ncbi:erg26, C-3 sterol dehydrogenase, partial [Basidiobolus ranarum]
MVQEKYLVVGGDGFLGHHLVQLLLQRTTADIVVLDIQQKHFQSEPRIEHKLGKIENFDEIVGAFQNITTVFHTASPGYAAKDEVLRATNIQGTENIIKSCQ